ncbi:type IV pilin [Methanonatronarchaeum thermophilum]|uniref:type IV pilin n=1 Tax=Methanonatronarchaeum thermophilum TaxID=1927129 RepID=UPI00117A7D09|nr:type IV pilin N-terminal domain-containing protein [Methanonatronarchaeum thermophilum]
MDEEGVSHVVGVILMLAVVVVFFGIVSAFVFGSIGSPDYPPQTSLSVDEVAEEDSEIIILHEFGDSLFVDETSLVVTDLSEPTNQFRIENLGDSGQFVNFSGDRLSVGERIEINKSFIQENLGLVGETEIEIMFVDRETGESVSVLETEVIGIEEIEIDASIEIETLREDDKNLTIELDFEDAEPYLVVENQDKDKEYTDDLEDPDLHEIEVDSDYIDGLDEGDVINASLYESSDRDVLLASSETEVLEELEEDVDFKKLVIDVDKQSGFLFTSYTVTLTEYDVNDYGLVDEVVLGAETPGLFFGDSDYDIGEYSDEYSDDLEVSVSSVFIDEVEIDVSLFDEDGGELISCSLVTSSGGDYNSTDFEC